MNQRTESSRPAAVGIAWGVLAILALAVSLFAFRIRECFVDDAFTGFQYIENLLAGHGFVFFPGARPVEGVTNIGWLLALAPLSAVMGPALAAKAAGLALLLASLVTTMLLCRGLASRLESASRSETPGRYDARPFGLTLIPTILLACSFEFIYFPLAGMETALLALVLLLMACVALRRPMGIAIPLLGAFAFLVHPEAAAVYPLYAAILYIRSTVGDDSSRRPSVRSDADRRLESPPTVEGDGRRKLITGSATFLVAILVITGIRFAYFGDVVPNTFHSKPSGIRLAVESAYSFLMGQNSNVAFPITGWLALPVLLLGCRRLRRASPAAADMLAATTAVGLIFAIYGPPDWTALPRYFAPYLPAALIVLWVGVEETAFFTIVGLSGEGTTAIAGGQRPAERLGDSSAGRRSPAIGRSRKPILAAIAIVLALTSIIDSRTRMSRMAVYPGYVLAGRALIEPAKWLRDHLAADATIATRRIGVVAYYSGRKVFDYTYGLPDPEVARLVACHGERFDAPTDPALKELWRSRAPEYLLEDEAIVDGIIAKAAGCRQRFSIHGIEYHVIRQFPIGDGANWVLAERLHKGE
jgi:hypothetical protein